MTQSEQPKPSGPTFDQHGQTVHGGQTNVYNVYPEAGPFTPSSLGKRCDFYQHVHLPSNYVLRPELMAEIKRTLLQSQQDIALTSSVLQSDALFGMGGIGKTVMARALCDDAEVRAAFPDGILWATLGQTPDLPARLRDWTRALGGTVPQTAPTLEELTNILAQSLAERHCLLIVDDVWDQAHLERFMVHVQGCRLLFTTRNAEIANELNATIRPVPVMSLREAIALLVEWAGTSVANIPQTQQEAIVERLGRLPLAIKLAGDQLRRRDPEKWLASFDARELRKRHIGNLHDSLENTFNLSLTDLTDIERQLYISLAIFKEDEAVVFPAVDKLWAELAGYNTNHTVDLLHFLNDRALLELADAQGNQAGARRDTMLLVTFHDLIRDLMRVELGTEGRHAAHVALLAAYRRSQKNKGWPSAPNDGYLYDHLVYHLGEVATHNRIARQELLDLFANHRWLHVRVPATGYRYDGYIADLKQVWTLYAQQSHPEARATGAMTSLPVHLRFALLRTSVNSLAANHAPSLVGYAVELGMWPTERALTKRST